MYVVKSEMAFGTYWCPGRFYLGEMGCVSLPGVVLILA